MPDPASNRSPSGRRTVSGTETRKRTRVWSARTSEHETARLEIVVAEWNASIPAREYGYGYGGMMRYTFLGADAVAFPKAPRRKYEHPSEILLARQLGQLLKIGTNVNQMARVMNGGGFVMPEILREAAEEITAAARDIRRTLELFG